MQKRHMNLSPFKTTSLLATWLILCLLWQALLPSFAAAQGSTATNQNPFWDEICSVIGTRVQAVNAAQSSQKTALSSAQDALSASQPSQPFSTSHHADCPLCLAQADVLAFDIVTPQISFKVALINVINATFASVLTSTFYHSPIQARAPPQL